MTTQEVKRKLAAILSADVKGYQRLMAKDEAGTLQTLNTYKEVMANLIRDHHGRVVEAPGDNVLAEFASVVDAVECGVEIQKGLRARNDKLSVHRKMEFRIGINLGDVVEEEDKIFGDGVNIAARMQSLADGGGLCISGTVYEHINRISSVWTKSRQGIHSLDPFLWMTHQSQLVMVAIEGLPLYRNYTEIVLDNMFPIKYLFPKWKYYIHHCDPMFGSPDLTCLLCKVYRAKSKDESSAALGKEIQEGTKPNS